MPPKRRGPLQTVQRETDDIKRKVEFNVTLSFGSNRFGIRNLTAQIKLQKSTFYSHIIKLRIAHAILYSSKVKC